MFDRSLTHHTLILRIEYHDAMSKFVCMIFETRQGETSRLDWKSSSLGLLFHGLDRQAISKEEMNELTRAREMEKIAEHTSVRLSQTESGWQFVRKRMGQ